MSKHLTPLEVCEQLVGPLDRIADICGMRPKATYVWRRASAWRQAGDIPSAVHMRALLVWAQANDVPLTADMLIRGASSDYITALQAAAHVRAA